MIRKLILAAALVFVSAATALAEGANSETIYNPNAPEVSADEEYSLSNELRDSGRREQLHLDQPWNRLFENGWLGTGQDDGY